MIYAAQNDIKINYMTVTLVCSNPPETLFKTLVEEFGYEILENEDGIYYITQKGVSVEQTLAIQVVVQKSELLLQALDEKMLGEEVTSGKLMDFLRNESKDNLKSLGYWAYVIFEFLKNISELEGGNMKNMTFAEICETLGPPAGLKQLWKQEGRQEGRREGRQEGRREGRREGVLQTARTMKDNGFSIEDIIKITHLSVDEILGL